MGILSSFFDVVAGVSILAGRSSLLDTNLTTIAGRNFTIRGALGLSFLSVGFINLWATSRKQRKIERLTKDAETFAGEESWQSGVREYFGDEEMMDFYDWMQDNYNDDDDDFIEYDDPEEWRSRVHRYFGDEEMMDFYDWLNKPSWNRFKEAETFEAQGRKTGVVCDYNGCKGNLLEIEYGKASKLHCDKCNYSEIMEWDAESFAACGCEDKGADTFFQGAETFNAPAAVMRTYKGRKSPSISAKSVKVGTRKRGNDGKMWQVRSVKSRGKRTQRWFKD